MGLTSASLKPLSVFAMVTGVSDVFFGSKLIEGLANEPLVVNSLATAMADNQMRFLGSAWAGLGAVLWWASNDIRNRRTPAALLSGAIFLGGIGRLLSALSTGYSNTFIKGATAVELVGPIILFLLFQRDAAAEAAKLK